MRMIITEWKRRRKHSNASMNHKDLKEKALLQSGAYFFSLSLSLANFCCFISIRKRMCRHAAASIVKNGNRQRWRCGAPEPRCRPWRPSARQQLEQRRYCQHLNETNQTNRTGDKQPVLIVIFNVVESCIMQPLSGCPPVVYKCHV